MFDPHLKDTQRQMRLDGELSNSDDNSSSDSNDETMGASDHRTHSVITVTIRLTARARERTRKRTRERISMRVNVEVLSFFDLTSSTATTTRC